MQTKSNYQGCIYILTNPSFPEYIKIGYADNIEKRLKQLNRSETIPFAFRVYATYDVDTRLTDKDLHRLIDQLNPDLRTIETFDGKERVKEFFAMTAEDAYGLLECIAKISGTQERLKRLAPEGHEVLDQQIADEVKETMRRGVFRFSMCGIQPGEKIVYVEDEAITPTVVDDRHIEWNGETTSMSALTQRLKGFSHPVQGTLYFTYNGEKLMTLAERTQWKDN